MQKSHPDNRLLFVYGTLRPGQGANALLKNCKDLGPAETSANAFNLVAYVDDENKVAYPGLLQGGGWRIKGNLYEVTPDDLERLNHYEGEDYERKPIRVSIGKGDDKRMIDVEAYFLKPDIAARFETDTAFIRVQDDPYYALEWITPD